MNKTYLLHLLSLCLLILGTSSCNIFSGSKGDTWIDLSLIPVVQDGQMGYIDWEGKYVIMPQFAYAYPFSQEGLAVVRTDDGMYGYINKKGNYTINPTYAVASHFSEGIAFVATSGEHLQAIDKKGNLLFMCDKAKMISNVREGLVSYMNWEGKYGVLDKKGNEVIPATFDYIGDFSEGLACFKDGGKYGFIDKKGTYVINPQFNDVTNFSGGIACVKSGDAYGVINKKGTYVINPQYDFIFPYTEGLALVGQGFKCGFVDKKGKYVINPQFGMAGPFNNGLAVASPSLDGKAGFINKKGEYVINPQFENTLTSFYKGKTLVYNGEVWGIIDDKGKYVANPQFDIHVGDIEIFPWQRNQLIHSQYYDTTELVKNLSDFLGDKDNAVHGFNHATTYGAFSEYCSATETKGYTDRHDTNRLATIYSPTITLAEHITMDGYKVLFDRDLVVRQSFWYGTQYNNDSKVIELTAEIKIGSEIIQYRASIINAIIELLSERYKVVSDKDEKSESDKITVSVKVDDNVITLHFVFPLNVKEEATEKIKEEESTEEEIAKASEAESKVETGRPVAKTAKIEQPAKETSPAWRKATIQNYNGYAVIRSQPNYDSEILNTIDSGTQVEAMPYNSEWSKVKWKGQTVYIPSDDLRY